MTGNFQIIASEIRTCDKSVNFFNEFLFLLGLEAVVPLRQSGLARSILDQDELDRHCCFSKISLLNQKKKLVSYFGRYQRADRFFFFFCYWSNQVENLVVPRKPDNLSRIGKRIKPDLFK